MKKGNIVKPTGLKGNDKLNRMRELMGTTSINENVSKSVVELTKEGPDGVIYGVVREGHEYYIKTAENKETLVTEDFNYIGGLQNKKDKAYGSYAKAIKMLNLKFMSLNEAAGKSGQVNVFLDDDLITEHHNISASKAFSEEKPMDSNIAKEYIVSKKGEELDYDADEDKETSGSNVAKGTAEADNKDVKMTANESAIDEMITGKAVKKKGYSIAKAMMEMDSVIDELSGEEGKVDAILESLSEDERAIMMEALKKNVNETYSRENAEKRLTYLASDKGVNLTNLDDKTREVYIQDIMNGKDITNDLMKAGARVNEGLKKKA